ncbi:hypothetical protein [Thermocoleostomius sinensis]|uniref:Uncharacterized protein n=1 Tax=Thermocoleostomius sinensis A174 TaxID=2016057 RepID=A0A9E8ZBY4_9CYAN|nr:hypothetical protein [Thermocoleostomius sinensis]WAL58583.1 hypothetical protein OXH18_15505 [Thermocoleostomius sinensis A174]
MAKSERFREIWVGAIAEPHWLTIPLHTDRTTVVEESERLSAAGDWERL